MRTLTLDIAHLLAGSLVLVSFLLLYQNRLYALLNVYALHAIVLAASVAWQAYAQDAPQLYITAAIALIFKAVMIPVALHRMIRRLGIHREVETVVGIGTTVLLHCDLVYASPEAKFALPFVNLGLVPEFASSMLLPHIIGYQRAAELLLLGEPFTAEQAHAHGLVNAVVPAADLMATVNAKAKILAAKPSASLRATKALLRGKEGAISDWIAKEVEIFSARLKSPEFKEAAAAFLEKRAPDFSKF